MAKAMKVLLAQFPLEVHSRGLTFVAGLLRSAGHEVVILGNASSDAIARAALDESAEAIGISTYCGGDVEQGSRLAALVPAGGPRLLIGGLLSDQLALESMGFRCFPSGCPPINILTALEMV